MKKTFYTYLLRCADGSIYCGYTTDIDRRMNEHKSNRGSKYVSARKFLRLEMYIELDDKKYALRLEYAIKKLKKENKERLILGDKSVLDDIGIDYVNVVYAKNSVSDI